MYTQIDKATEYLRKFIKITPDVVIVLNSSLNSITKEMQATTEIPFTNIPGFVGTDNPGTEKKLTYGILENKYVLVVTGKLHYYEGPSYETLALPYRVFANMGIKNIIFTTQCGAINEDLNVGDIVIFKDHISLFAPNLLIGKNYSRFGPRLIDASNIYNANLRNLILQNINTDDNKKLKEGTYCFYSGPSYETIADIKALKILGADMVGMATVPEATVCHQSGMNVIGLSIITNRAAGLNTRPLSYREVILNARIGEAKEKTTLRQILKLIPKE